MIKFVDLQKQYRPLQKEIKKEVDEVLSSGKYILGPKTENFERKFAEFCGANYALAANNGTSALLLAILALGIKKGDEIVTQPNTFVATAEAILFSGAKPVFVDINPQSCNLDVNKIERAVTKRTRAILPVHLFGQPSDMTPILKIAKKRKLFVIEDCAQAHGAEYKGKRVGSLGDIGCFSFYPTKVLGAMGEGGAVVTNNKKLFGKMKTLRDHGSSKKYEHSEIGFNFRLEEIQAAILGVKMKYLEKWIEARRRTADIYSRLLKGLPAVIPFEPKNSKSVYYVYAVRTKERDKLQVYLTKEGIGTMIHYPVPIHLQKGYQFLGHRKGDFPEAERAARETLSLPFYPELELEEQKRVAEKLRDFYFGESRNKN